METAAGGGTLLTLGIILMAAAVAGAIVAAIVFRISGKRLKERLEAEYGKKRR